MKSKLCMICSAKFPDGTEHECPPDAKKRFAAEMFARNIQLLPKSKRMRHAREVMPGITPAQVAAIVDGEMEWAELYRMFGVEMAVLS